MTTQTTTTNTLQLDNLPVHLIGEITRHLDNHTIIRLLPESYYPPGLIREVYAQFQKEKREAEKFKENATALAIEQAATIRRHEGAIVHLDHERWLLRNRVTDLENHLIESHNRTRQILEDVRHAMEQSAQTQEELQRTRRSLLQMQEKEASRLREPTKNKEEPKEETMTDHERQAWRMTVKELKLECKRRGLRKYSALRKAELVEMYLRGVEDVVR